MHARPAGLLVKLAKTFSSTVTIEKDGKSVNPAKLMPGMGIKCGFWDICAAGRWLFKRRLDLYER
ncbi:MAG: HPr family phosphocarrier protein [Firmicutes bacterium]|nr:HPr family phosphocarrier protein [Bacillota bacterium]